MIQKEMQEIPLFDAHTHIHFPAYDTNRKEVITRAKNAGVKMILVGTQASTSRMGVELARAHKGEMWATAGFHPNHVITEGWYHDPHEQEQKNPETFDIAVLKAIAKEEETVAIGECGLDYFRLAPEDLEKQKANQKEAFMAQIELAKELEKPLMIHCRSAFDDLISIFQSEKDRLPSRPGVIHFFTGTIEHAKLLLDLGFSFTFGGVITFTHDYDEVIQLIPAERILSETDAPYVAPMPYRGTQNEPAYIIETVKRLAELKGATTEEMKTKIWENAMRIFNMGQS